jgi:hypothetical protein
MKRRYDWTLVQFFINLSYIELKRIVVVPKRNGSAVDIATIYELNYQRVGVRVPVAPSKSFASAHRPDPGATQPPVQWVLGAPSSSVNRQAPEANHSPPTSAEVKKTWIYTSTPPYVLMAQWLVSETRYNFTFYLGNAVLLDLTPCILLSFSTALHRQDFPKYISVHSACCVESQTERNKIHPKF